MTSMTDKTMLDRVADAIQSASVNQPWSYENAARAAITAMRQPSPAMVKAGWEMGGSPRADIWRAMIDAALAKR